ncbi:hypothetical protein NL676_008317 [Syzygium grande]|nr:hypothetical protein NL676_008317 [Syzygium grande]
MAMAVPFTNPTAPSARLIPSLFSLPLSSGVVHGVFPLPETTAPRRLASARHLVLPAPGCHDSIVSFGDSLADTGNLLHLSRSDGHPTEAGFPPYGETYFRRPTGRFSDGRLVIDFVAERLGLPYVAPFYGDDGGRSVADFGKGVNFAVAGATALDAGFFEGRGMGNSFPNESLGVQLGLFKGLLPSLCNTSSDCNEFLGKSLVLMGEIGGNDYNYPFFMGSDLEEIQELVPLVLEEIVLAINV